MGFWTRVRLPSSPLNRARTNPVQAAYIGVFRNVCGIILDVNFDDIGDDNVDMNKLSFGNIRRWVADEFGVKVSNGSINQVMKKCGIERLDADDAKLSIELKSEKEKLVYEAFKHFNVVSNLS